MRRTWLSALLAVCSACSFEGSSSPIVEGTAPPDSGVALVTCEPDTALSLCLEFEDQQPTTSETDGSSFRNNATADNVQMMTGHSAEAALLTSSSSITVPRKPELSPSETISFELWLQPTGTPDDDSGLIDNDGEYGMKVLVDGEIRCVIGTSTIDSGISLIEPDGHWHHAACVYDQAALQVFVDGQLAGCRPLTRTISASGHTDLAIGAESDEDGHLGEHFHGGVDSVKLYTRALDADEVCSEAGHTGCIETCPII